MNLQKIDKPTQIEGLMLQLPQVDMPLHHEFLPGMYIRTMFTKAGTIAVGHRHKHFHINVLSKGRILLMDGEGLSKELAAPIVFVGNPGIKKVAYFLEDTIWLNIFNTDETDLDKLEEELIEKSEAWESAKLLNTVINLKTGLIGR